MEKQSYVYILTNYEESTFYVGVTSDLVKRIFTHREKLNEGFSKKYNLTKLVYYEVHCSIEQAIFREKKIKGGSRQKKIDLIDKFNPKWEDLWGSIIG